MVASFAATMFTVATTVLSNNLRQLYGDNFCAPSLMLCGLINTLLAQLPQGFLVCKGCCNAAHFIPITRGFSLRSVSVPPMPMLSMAILNRTSDGHFTSQRKSLSVMRYCPVCYQEDLQLHGEPYWHRSHQLPDMQICTKHRCWLVDTDVAYNSTRQQELFPASFTMQLKSSQQNPYRAVCWR